MKNTKSKILHKSFLTNQDLIQGLRNQSFASNRQASSRVHTQRSKITLLKKKSFDRVRTEQENSFYGGNYGTCQPTGSTFDHAVFLLQDCITSLGDQNQKLMHKLKKVLTYVRDIGQQQKKTQKMLKTQKAQLQELSNKKLQIQREQTSKLKKMNEDLKLKIMQYREKILSIKKQSSSLAKQKPSSGLQQIIINQSQIIDKQCDQYSQQNNQMRRMIHTQALQIEDFFKNKKSPSKMDELRLYTSLQNSFVFRK